MPTDKTVFINFYPSDWLSGVSELSVEARGVYINLLAMYWNKNGKVRDDDPWLARQCNVSTRKFRLIKKELSDAGKIEVIDGRLHNDRAETTLKTALKLRENSRIKASKAAEKRWEKPQETAENHNSSDAPSIPSSNASQSQSQISTNNILSSDGIMVDFVDLGKELIEKHNLGNRTDFLPLKTWLTAGIKPDLIRRVVSDVSERAMVGGKIINSFKFFEREIMAAQGLSKGNGAVKKKTLTDILNDEENQ